MNTNPLNNSIVESCCKLIKEFATMLRAEFGSDNLPYQKISYTLMEPTGSGGHSGRECFIEEIDLDGIWHNTEKTITSCMFWNEAKTEIETLISVENISLPWPDYVSNLLRQLLNQYLKDIGHIRYEKSVAIKLIGQMIDQLFAPGIEYIGLVILGNFNAVKPFQLEKNITFRPIATKDIKLLVHANAYPFFSLHESTKWIFSDWWVCEIKKMNIRGTYDGQNKISEMVHDDLALSLRMFKKGDTRIKLGVLKVSSPFEGTGILRGGQMEHISSGSLDYQLSVNEIKKLREFWQKIQVILNNKEHYLQIPLRRMLHAGTRKEKTDSIIDYVIALEALLGTNDEQMEINYRFKIRGAVILASKRAERLQYISKLQNLYKLRSKIAHGSHVPNSQLDEYLPFAEDSLRTIWRWYFNHYRLESKNEAGINKVDIDLCIK